MRETVVGGKKTLPWFSKLNATFAWNYISLVRVWKCHFHIFSSFILQPRAKPIWRVEGCFYNESIWLLTDEMARQCEVKLRIYLWLRTLGQITYACTQTPCCVDTQDEHALGQKSWTILIIFLDIAIKGVYFFYFFDHVDILIVIKKSK